MGHLWAPAKSFESLRQFFGSRASADEKTARWLYTQGQRLGPGAVCLEIGTWQGWTAACLAAHGSRVIALDTFDGHTMTTGKRVEHIHVWMDNLVAAGMGDRIIGVIGKSPESASVFPDHMADLLFLDGDKTTEDAVRNDILAWRRVVKPGGLLCGHDWEWESVKIGVCLALDGQEVGLVGGQCWSVHC